MIPRARGLLVAGAVLAMGALGPGPARAQSSWLTGYLQSVPLFAGATPFTEAGASVFNRLRLTTEPVFGPFAVEVAWDHALTARRTTPTSASWAGWARSPPAASGSICSRPPSIATTSGGCTGWTASTSRGSRTTRSR